MTMKLGGGGDVALDLGDFGTFELLARDNKVYMNSGFTGWLVMSPEELGADAGGLTSAAQFCERLMADEGVAVVPGDAFGDPRWVRMSYAASDKDLTSALERITRFVSALVATPTAV